MIHKGVLVFLQSELNGTRVDISGDNEDPKAIIAHNLNNMPRRERIDAKLDFHLGVDPHGGSRNLAHWNEEQHADVPTEALWRQKSWYTTRQ